MCTCTFDAAEGMVAVFLRVPLSLAPFALHYLLFDLRWFEFYDSVHWATDVVDFLIVGFLF